MDLKEKVKTLFILLLTHGEYGVDALRVGNGLWYWVTGNSNSLTVIRCSTNSLYFDGVFCKNIISGINTKYIKHIENISNYKFWYRNF